MVTGNWYQTITVRDGKGKNDRVTVLLTSLIQSLQAHLEQVRQQDKEDLAPGYSTVYLPDALVRTYPHAEREWAMAVGVPLPSPLCRPPLWTRQYFSGRCVAQPTPPA